MALDLFAGVGLFSIPLAQKFEKVLAVESNPAATRDMESNVRGQGRDRSAHRTTWIDLWRGARSGPSWWCWIRRGLA